MSSFPTTHWTLIRSAAGTERREALEELCRAYWPPLYAFLRGQGNDADEALDLVQGYFTLLLEKDYVGDFDPERGRFRTFLIRSLRNFSSKERERARALRRGGGAELLSLDDELAPVESAVRSALRDDITPEALFERNWAETVLDRARDRLCQEYVRRNQQEAFEELLPFIDGSADPPSHAEVAEQLGLARHSVKVILHRFRRRFRAAVSDVLTETVADEEGLEAELRHLVEVLGRPV